MRDRYRTSLTKTCALFGMSRSLYRYQSVARDSSALLMRIKEITATRVHYGYRRVHVVLRREGWRDNCKRVYRLYRAEGLSLRHKRPRRNKSARLRQPKHIVTAINEIWSMDFVADSLFDGRRLRTLTVVDNYTRECLAIEVGQSLKGEHVVEALTRITAMRGHPPRSRSTMAASSFRRQWIAGPMNMALNWISAGRARPLTTPRSKASTGASGRSV
ncbi:HTH-like domain protein [Burkholderia pseudomallei]|nr:HTH-like domain protein [Burkholderia pseudomallei]